jgi:hypothetical protein
MALLQHRVFCWSLLPLLAALPVVAIGLAPQLSAPTGIPLTTEDRLQAPGWWPTKGTALRADFAGTAECAKCHEKLALGYITTPMAQASAPAVYSQALQSHDQLSAQLAPYHYELARDAAAVNYSVTDGSNSLNAVLVWAFGLGQKGQTYLYQRESGHRQSNPRTATFYESRLSFYKTLQGLDLTTGHNSATPGDLESALGRSMDADEARRCFGCHTTASTTTNRFDPSHVTPGVTCEACHGPGAKHVAAMKTGKIEEGRRAILDPRRLDPAASVDFCGACHRTRGDILQGGFTGVVNVRFQPYRLENSRCWRNADARLACTACHDAHQPLALDPGSYDHNCLACHAAASHEPARSPETGQSDHLGPACPVSTKDCVTCHMPRVELPSMHAPFTDHRIRIAHPGEPYPD